METKPEVMEAHEAELIPADLEVEETPTQALTANHMDSMIAVAAKVESFAKAMDTIYGVIIKRAYENDWTCHDRSDVPPADRKANIGAAAAERIAAFLGVTERNWKARKEVAEDGQSYTYIHEADFTLGSRTIHVMGQAGTKDRFFGYANGAWKPLDEIKESDIRTASLRACRKEGVRTLLGLRNIPIARLQSLGLNIEKIKQVNFQSKLSTAEKDPSLKAVDGLVWKDIKVITVSPKRKSADPKKPWTLYDISDGKITYSMFANPGSHRLQKLMMCQEDQTAVKIGIKVGTYNGNDTYQIEAIEGVEDK